MLARQAVRWIRRGVLWALGAAVVTISLLGAASAPASADNARNVDCSAPDLISAVNQADAAGSGTINLASGCTYTFTTPYSGVSALPVIAGLTGPLTINGNGATLQRSGADGTPDFRLLEIGEGSGDVTINELTITGGSVTGGSSTSPDGAGGGIYTLARLTLIDSTISHNSASVCGGGVAAPLEPLVVRDSTISDNAQTKADTVQSPLPFCPHSHVLGGGGGLFVSGATRITGSTIAGNTTAFGGGGVSGGGSGGVSGLENPSDPRNIVLTNDTIVGNQAPPASGVADGGGGIWSTLDTLLVNDTIAGNQGTALATFGADASTPSWYYLQGNIIDGGCGARLTGNLSLGSNVLVGGWCPNLIPPEGVAQHLPQLCPPAGCGPDVTDATSADLGPLEDNGGPTETEAIGPDSPAYHLEAAGNCPPTDQRGVPRPQPPAANACNAGAYETQAVATMLSYTGPTSGDYGTPLTLTAALTHPDAAVGVPTPAGGGVSHQTVTIGFGAESCTATTDASGQASCQVTPTDAPAGSPYQLTASYAGGPDGVGTDYYQASSDTSQSFTVNKRPTSLSATPALPSGISATLTDSNTGAPLSGQTLVFTAGGSRLCTATTNASGTASCRALGASLGALLHLGYTVSYAGSADYAPSSATGSAIGLGRGFQR
jgi:hypothetical protein